VTRKDPPVFFKRASSSDYAEDSSVSIEDHLEETKAEEKDQPNQLELLCREARLLQASKFAVRQAQRTEDESILFREIQDVAQTPVVISDLKKRPQFSSKGVRQHQISFFFRPQPK